MAYLIKNKTLCVLNNDGTYSTLNTIDSEIFLTADPIKGLFSFDDYYKAVTSPMSRRVVRIYLLNSDETIKQDITEYVTACKVDLSYQQGKTRSASLTLLNTSGMWTPDPVKGFLWKGSKFRIDAGKYYNGKIFWGKYGIFTPINPTINDSSQTVEFQMEDKFAFLNGTAGGKIDSNFKIPVGTPVRKAIEMCCIAEKDIGGIYDTKPILYPSDKDDITTPYTITKSPGLTYGEIIIELADMISCDVYYNELGNLVVSGNSDDNPLENRSILWSFDDTTALCTKPTISIDWTNVVNKVTVVGSIVNGYIHKGVAINDSAESRTNVNLTNINAEYIEDSNIYSDVLCEERAKYELRKKTLLALQAKFDCMFIPNLVPNKLVSWTSIKHGFLNEKFFINSISLDVLNPSLMNISLTNIREVSL